MKTHHVKNKCSKNEIFSENFCEKKNSLEKFFGSRNELLTWKYDYQFHFCMNFTNLQTIYQYLTSVFFFQIEKKSIPGRLHINELNTHKWISKLPSICFFFAIQENISKRPLNFNQNLTHHWIFKEIYLKLSSNLNHNHLFKIVIYDLKISSNLTGRFHFFQFLYPVASDRYTGIKKTLVSFHRWYRKFSFMIWKFHQI